MVFFPSYHGKHMELNGTDKLMEVYEGSYGKHMEVYKWTTYGTTGGLWSLLWETYGNI